MALKNMFIHYTNIPYWLTHTQRQSLEEFFRLIEYNAAYEVLHLSGYYDGLTKYDVIKSGFESAAAIINKIKPAGLAGLQIE